MDFYSSIEHTIDELKKNQYGIILKKTKKNMSITISIKFPKEILNKEISQISIEFLLIIDLYKPKFNPKLYCLSPYCYPNFADGRDIFNELPSIKNPKKYFDLNNILSEILEFININFQKCGLNFFGKYYLGSKYDLRILQKSCSNKNNILNVKENLVLNGKNIKLNRILIISDVYFLMFEQEKFFKNNLILIFWSSINNIQKIQKVKGNKTLIMQWTQKEKGKYAMILTMNQRENFINIILEKMKQFGMAYDKYKYESGDYMNKKKRKDLESQNVNLSKSDNNEEEDDDNNNNNNQEINNVENQEEKIDIEINEKEIEEEGEEEKNNYEVNNNVNENKLEEEKKDNKEEDGLNNKDIKQDNNNKEILKKENRKKIENDIKIELKTEEKKEQISKKEIGIFKNINSKYILKQVFSFLQLNIYYKIIKYNKKLQKRLNISFEDSIFDYRLFIKTNSEIKSDILEMQKKLNSISSKGLEMPRASFSSKFCLKYSYPFQINLREKDKKFMFLIKYKGFKIDYYPIFLNVKSLRFPENIKFFEKNEYFFKYTLNNENIKLINIINELREKRKFKKLIYNKRQNLNDFFQEQNSSNEKYLFKYPIGEFKNKLLNNDKKINKILLKENLKFIIILEKEKNEYILIYENSKDQDNINVINNSENILEKNKLQNFHIINNTVPEIIIDYSLPTKRNLITNLNIYSCNNSLGYQILSFKVDTLIGLLEGPPNTPYENGYFLFKLLISSSYPIQPPKFCFLTNIFHPNISDNGYVSEFI